MLTLPNGLRYLHWPHIMLWMLAVGLFLQITGKVWIVSGGARNTQIYLWLLLPSLVFVLSKYSSWRTVFVEKQYLPWLAFLAWVALSSIWATGSETEAWSLAKRGLFICLYFLSIRLLLRRREEVFRRVLLFSVAVVTVGALVSLVHQYGVVGKPIGFRAYRIDRSGIGGFVNYGWPVAAGIFNGAVSVWAIGYALDKRSSTLTAALWFIAYIVLATYVVMTGSRGAVLALAGSSILAVLLQRSKFGVRLLVVVSVASVFAGIYFWDNLVYEFTDKQLSGRGDIWIYYLRVMSEHWWFGYGLGTPFQYHWPNGLWVSPHAHSLYLQQVYDSGVISLVLLLSGLVGVTYKAWLLRHNPWVRLVVPALLFALIAMLTDVERIFTRPSDMWTVFWLPVAILLALHPAEKSLISRWVGLVRKLARPNSGL
ncbi:O-antigen ligase family protein [Enterobacterales bacterium BD_CKDN230030183-1A_HGKHYDSX7]